MHNNEVVEKLDALIETNKDGQAGYRVAAENIKNSEFRRLFNIFSQQRAQFIAELQSEIRRLGAEPSGSSAGSVGRGWHTLSSASELLEESAIISACQNGEEAAVNNYQEALKADLPVDVQYVVKRQYMDIKDAFDRIRILQRAA